MMEEKGSKRVEVAGLNITAVFCGSFGGEFYQCNLFIKGKIPACLPQYVFPDDWNVMYTSNHWSNELGEDEGIHS